MVLLSLLPLVLLPVVADQEMDRSRVRKTIVCGIQYNHATSACVLIVANENDFTVGSVRVEVELGNPDGVIEHKTITVKRIKGNRFHLIRFKPKRDLGPVAIVEAKAFSAKIIKKKGSKKRPKQSKGLKKDLKQARSRISDLESSHTKAIEQCRATSRRRFLLYFKELDNVLRESGLSDQQATKLIVIFQFAVEVFKGERAGRADFVSEAEQWMASKTRSLQRKADEEQERLDARVRSSPKTILELLSGENAASSAKIKASLLGRSVVWTGTVTEVVTNMFYDHELELSCDGVKVEVDLLNENGRLPVMGQDIKVRGTIENIEDYGIFGATIRLSRCRIEGT